MMIEQIACREIKRCYTDIINNLFCDHEKNGQITKTGKRVIQDILKISMDN